MLLQKILNLQLKTTIMMDNKDNNSSDHNDELSRLVKSYERYIPFQLSNILGKNNIADANLGDQVEKKFTVLFSDIRDFTTISESLTPKETFDFINSFLNQIATVISNNNGVVNKFMGDSVMAIFPDESEEAVKCSILMLEQLDQFNAERKKAGLKTIEIGIGLNTGFCMLGILGSSNRFEFTVIGDAVNLASRVETLTKLYGVPFLVSENTINTINAVSKYSIRFIDRVEVKGKKHPQSIYEIFDNDPVEVKKLKTETKIMFEEALAHYHYKNIEYAQELLEKCIKINPADNPAKVYLERCKAFSKNGFHQGAKELNEDIEWSSYFEVGHKQIDEQHFELFSKSIKLLNSIDKKENKSEIDGLIDFIDNYIKNHFTTEENFLESIKYPFLENQKLQHINFIRAFEQLKKEMQTSNISKTYIKFRIHILLIDWIINHILKEDKHYSKFLKLKNTDSR